VRLDTGVETGSEVSGRFDSMMAKLIVTGSDRDAALARARRALAEFRIEGVASVLPFHRAVLDDVDFVARDGFAVHTQWIETTFADRTPPQALASEPLDVEVVSSWIEVDGKRMSLRLPAAMAGSVVAGTGTTSQATSTDAREAGAKDGDVLSPMAGTLVRWTVEDGAAVEQGDTIAVVEAMKMETAVVAPSAGLVHRANDAPSPGDPVSSSTALATISPA
jgi:acetyl-CoA/propionyl-CoA carboxylase biotin carboxyl carrier protein